MLAPRWGPGRPRRITDADIEVVVATAKTRPKRLGLPFTHWSIRKLTAYLDGDYGHRNPAWVPARAIRIGRERVRAILHEHDISFQRTRTWKTSADPAYDAKLDRIDEVVSRFPDRCFAFDQFGPLSIRPCHGTCWAARRHPDRLPATYHRTHGIRYFHGCYSLSEDKLWGVLHEHKGGAHTLAAFKTIRAARPDGGPIYIVCDNLSVNTTPAIRTWAAAHKVELCLTPTNASWAAPSRRSSGPCACSPSPTRTTPTTSPWPAPCTPTYAGATPTTVTPTSWPPNAENAPASAANTTNAGAADPKPKPPNEPGHPFRQRTGAPGTAP
jgi:hypothetical protein